MRLMILSLSIALLATTPVFADTGDGMVLPEIPMLDEQGSVDLLTALVVTTVVAQNCDGVEVSEAALALIDGSARILSDRFQLDPPQYNEMFLHPAYGVLSRDGGCAQEAANIQPLLDQLIGWGGAVGTD